MKLEQIAVIFSNFSSQDSAKAVAKQLMDENLATCANIMAPHYAIYPWDEQIQEEEETATLFKTPIEKKDALVKRLREIHPYDLPPIIAYEAEATDDYVKWLNDPYNYKPEVTKS